MCCIRRYLQTVPYGRSCVYYETNISEDEQQAGGWIARDCDIA